MHTDLQLILFGSLGFAGLFESKTRQLFELLGLGNVIQQLVLLPCYFFILKYLLETLLCSHESAHSAGSTSKHGEIKMCGRGD